MGMPKQTLSCKLTIMFFKRTTFPYFSEEVKKKIMTKQTDIGNENHCRCFEPTSFVPEHTFPYPGLFNSRKSCIFNGYTVIGIEKL